jgi:hypothetical protein
MMQVREDRSKHIKDLVAPFIGLQQYIIIWAPSKCSSDEVYVSNVWRPAVGLWSNKQVAS